MSKYNKHKQPIPQNKFNAPVAHSTEMYDFRATFISLVNSFVDGSDDDLFGCPEGFWVRGAQIYEARIVECAKICDQIFKGTPYHNTVELKNFEKNFLNGDCDYTYVYNALTKNADIFGRFEQLLLNQNVQRSFVIDGRSEIVFAMANSGMGNYIFQSDVKIL